MEETLRALDDLQRQGKILYPAVSNWAAWQITKALGISAKEQLARFELIQPMYNLVKRQAEVEIFADGCFRTNWGNYLQSSRSWTSYR
ncbi:hypothetical protein GCM10020331_096960 [Ectobacillus funiculus]